ncbi:hypothetical protein I3760_14G086500 [Carya illinoinensis]|nr:hypothetical protein I3760_14G086500 [Carya illinoinensis]
MQKGKRFFWGEKGIQHAREREAGTSVLVSSVRRVSFSWLLELSDGICVGPKRMKRWTSTGRGFSKNRKMLEVEEKKLDFTESRGVFFVCTEGVLLLYLLSTFTLLLLFSSIISCVLF